MIDPVIEVSLRLALALLFAAAAWHKVSDRVRFGATVRAYRLMPPRLVSPVTQILPLAEVSIAIGLLYPQTQHAAAFAAVLLLVLYTVAIAANLALGRREIDCGCFASSTRVPLSNGLVVRNVILIVAAGVLVMPIRGRSLIWIDALTIVATLITLSVLWAARQRLAQTGPALRRLGGAR
jgi:uncharacterized membrane protein YphA (DoxX/SURF4 family)